MKFIPFSIFLTENANKQTTTKNQGPTKPRAVISHQLLGQGEFVTKQRSAFSCSLHANAEFRTPTPVTSVLKAENPILFYLLHPHF